MTETELVNLALAAVGSNFVAEIDEEPLLRPLLVQAFQEVLREHDWNFAQKLVQLPLIVDNSPRPIGYPSAFDLPADFIKRVSLHDGSSALEAIDYKLLGRSVFCRRAEIVLTYVSSEMTISEWPPDFRQTVVILLASKIAQTQLKSISLCNSLLDRYLKIDLPGAITNDTTESPGGFYFNDQAAASASPTIRARHSSYRGGGIIAPPA